LAPVTVLVLQTRDTASAAAKEAVALGTRARKTEIDHTALRTHWHDTANAFGADMEQHIETARDRSLTTPEATREQQRDTAREAISFASEKLAERSARFTSRDLFTEARTAAFGQASELDLRSAIRDAESAGALVARQARGYDPVTGRREMLAGYTTPQAIATERTLVATAQRMRGNTAPICQPDAARAAMAITENQTGYAFNQSQRTATLGLLTSHDRLQLVQGYAGTAKTTSVLATTAAEVVRQGQIVRALAPTSSAAQTLAAAMGTDGMTVARHLATQERGPESATRETWIVDEASLLSARELSRLLTLAETQQARVILVGDVKQLGSVEAGSAFQQVQEQTSLKTHVLDQIVRQRNGDALGAVHAAIRGDAREALHAIDRAGVVQSHSQRSDRVSSLVSDYMTQSPDQRQHALVIALGRDDRHEINDAIRTAMRASGELTGPTIQAGILVAKDLTRVEMRRADRYEVGDVIRFGRDYQRLGISKGEYATVTGVNTERNQLTVETETGQVASYNPRTHAKTESFSVESREIQVGDQLRVTRNDKGSNRTNGQQLRVERIDGTQISARDAQGHLQTLDTAVLRDSHLEHAYCSTAYAAQGKTADRVFVHAESFRTNLATQQSFYVAVSRAQDEVRIYTDDREKLIGQVERESGQKSQALERSTAIPEREPKSQRSTHVSSERETHSAQERDFGFE
jgi:ATP-dependent exoDNAse (exonuclease V) alpha subunit